MPAPKPSENFRSLVNQTSRYRNYSFDSDLEFLDKGDFQVERLEKAYRNHHSDNFPSKGNTVVLDVRFIVAEIERSEVEPQNKKRYLELKVRNTRNGTVTCHVSPYEPFYPYFWAVLSHSGQKKIVVQKPELAKSGRFPPDYTLFEEMMDHE